MSGRRCQGSSSEWPQASVSEHAQLSDNEELEPVGPAEEKQADTQCQAGTLAHHLYWGWGVKAEEPLIYFCVLPEP